MTALAILVLIAWPVVLLVSALNIATKNKQEKESTGKLLGKVTLVAVGLSVALAIVALA